LFGLNFRIKYYIAVNDHWYVTRQVHFCVKCADIRHAWLKNGAAAEDGSPGPPAPTATWCCLWYGAPHASCTNKSAKRSVRFFRIIERDYGFRPFRTVRRRNARRTNVARQISVPRKRQQVLIAHERTRTKIADVDKRNYRKLFGVEFPVPVTFGSTVSRVLDKYE